MTLSQNPPTTAATNSFDASERHELEAAAALLMEQLSQAPDAPDGFVVSAVPLVASEISWSNGGWASCLADIEGWLRFDEELPFHSRDAQARMLSKALGFKDTASAFVGAPADLRLTDAGLEQLHDLLDRALRHQRGFLEIEEVAEQPSTVAEQAWEESWQEEQPELEPSSGPIAAKAAVWNINDFSSRAEKGKLNLSPSYQRADVWPTADAQLLIESIVRGIPLPSVIVLRPQENANAPFEIVDGKQRLTSILRFIGAHPVALRHISSVRIQTGKDLMQLFRHDYPRFRKEWAAATGQTLTAAVERELYFPFRLSTSENALNGGLEHLRGKYYSQIRQQTVEVADETVEIEDLFERVTEYKIPVIEYLRASHRQIHEVFNLYNKQGKHLNAEEIRNALYHDLDLMRGLLVAAGDNNDLESVAPFLASRWAAVEPVGRTLIDLGVGTLRYRRTKVLSWALSLLVDDSRDEATGKPRRRSTARQIDALLTRVQLEEHDELRSGQALQDLFGLVSESILDLDREADAWAPRFKDGSRGLAWQDLPLVGTIVGLAAARAVLGDGFHERLQARRSEIFRASSSDPAWERPSKTQTDTQWTYLAGVALGTLRVLDVDPAEASANLSWRFGHSGIQALLAVEAMHR